MKIKLLKKYRRIADNEYIMVLVCFDFYKICKRETSVRDTSGGLVFMDHHYRRLLFPLTLEEGTIMLIELKRQVILRLVKELRERKNHSNKLFKSLKILTIF